MQYDTRLHVFLLDSRHVTEGEWESKMKHLSVLATLKVKSRVVRKKLYTHFAFDIFSLFTTAEKGGGERYCGVGKCKKFKVKERKRKKIISETIFIYVSTRVCEVLYENPSESGKVKGSGVGSWLNWVFMRIFNFDFWNSCEIKLKILRSNYIQFFEIILNILKTVQPSTKSTEIINSTTHIFNSSTKTTFFKIWQIHKIFSWKPRVMIFPISFVKAQPHNFSLRSPFFRMN